MQLFLYFSVIRNTFTKISIYGQEDLLDWPITHLFVFLFARYLFCADPWALTHTLKTPAVMDHTDF